MEADDLAQAVGMMEWHAILHCPQNDLLFQTLDQYEVTHQLTEIVTVPGNLSVKERRALIDTLLVLRRCWWPLWSLHTRGLCLGGRFNANNFIVYSELSVRLNDIMVMELNKELGDLDYYQFVKVVLDQVFIQEQTPRGVLRWLRLISNGLEGYGYLITYHNSMMEPHQAVVSHMSLYSKFLELETTDNKLFCDIISSLPQYDGWQGWSRTCSSSLLNDTRTYVNPMTGNRINYENDVRGVLKLARHCWQHHALFVEGFFTLVVAQDFPWLFADFQEAMHDAGLVVQLHLEACMR